MKTSNARAKAGILLLATALGLLVEARSVSAATEVVDGVEWSYTVSGGRATVTGAAPAYGSLTIPSALGGQPVAAIGDRAFSCGQLTSLSVPGCVKRIGKEAFGNCNGLQTVSIAEGVTEIGEWAFIYCGSLKSVGIPDSLEKIGERAFEGCPAALFDAATIPGVLLLDGWAVGHKETLSGALNLKKVRGIADQAFDACGGLTSVKIPNGVKRIGDYAFSWCTGLKGIAIPDSVTEIGKWAFSGCSKMKTVAFGKGLKRIGDEAFFGCNRLVDVTIPDGVTSIGSAAFSHLERVTAVTIPNSVTHLGDRAFAYDRAMTSVKIGNGVKNIGDEVFVCCSELKKVSGANNVTNIGEAAFKFCKGLESWTVPNKVAHIGDSAFASCGNLKSLVIPASVKKIEDEAFCDTGLKTLYVPASWKGTSKLKHASVPAGCKVVYGLPSWTVTFDANGGSCSTKSRKVVKGDAVGTLPKATRTGYALSGWYTAKSGGSKVSTSTKIKADRTFHARWTPTKYKIAFNANGGTGTMAAQSVKYGASAKLRANAFKRTGYTFKGWAKTAAGAVAYENAASVKNLRSDGKTVTLYAKWKATKYKVAFKANGGTGTMGVQTLTYGKTAKLAKNSFKRSGWTFLGWAKTKTGAVAFKNAQSVKNLGKDGKTTTLYAVWAKNSYKVAFKANGGTGSMAVQAMKYGTAAKLRKNAFKRTGYVFAGWAKTAKGSVAYKDAESVKNLRTDGGSTTLYAKWKATTYKVAFDANGGTGTMATQSVKYGTAAELPANVFRRDGFTFAGWAKSAGGAKAYADRASVKNLRSDGGTVTLYAVWEKNPAAETSSTPVPVPYGWLDVKAARFVTANDGDREAAAKAKAANGVNTVWECYVAGLDPEEKNETFSAELSIVDGKPVVSSDPREESARSYTVYGKKDLADGSEDWSDVTANPDPAADGYRFFRVGVSLPR